MFALSLVLHIVGVSVLLGGTLFIRILESRFRKAENPSAAAVIHDSISAIGVLSPFASLLLLVTGIANIILVHIDVFSTPWLELKLACFLLAIPTGIAQGKAYRSRAGLVTAVVQKVQSGDNGRTIEMLTRRCEILWKIQTTLIVAALVLTIFGIYA
jgi:uncharacterized membrane protein SirB2